MHHEAAELVSTYVRIQSSSPLASCVHPRVHSSSALSSNCLLRFPELHYGMYLLMVSLGRPTGIVSPH